MRARLPFLLALLLGCTAGEPPASPASEPPVGRRVRIRYVAQLTDLPPGERVRLWIPLPAQEDGQSVSGLEVEAPWPHRESTDPTWGNRVLYLEGPATEPTLEVAVSYEVVRGELRADLAGEDAEAEVPARFLQPSALVRPDAAIRAVHAEATPAQGTTLEVARAYYDRVRADMTYDKSGEGWGRGDSVYACEVGRGNCTDFHAYFQALCQLQGIPSRFAIGLFGPYERRPGEAVELDGYHCWAGFHAPGVGWVPVDISEADKDPSRADYFFGSLTDNRVTLSRGRDLVLDPPQAGPPLNFFVDPYAEVAGAPVPTSKTATWTDLE